MKRIILFCLILFLTGCTKSPSVFTMVERADTGIRNVHYPITKVKKVDEALNSYVNEVYQIFFTHHANGKYLCPELNIDYTYQHLEDRYLNITLFTYILDEVNHPPIDDVFSLFFDKSSHSFLSLKEVIKEESWENFSSLTKAEFQQQLPSFQEQEIQNLAFQIEEEVFSLYFVHEEELFTVTFPLDAVPLKFSFEPSPTPQEKIIPVSNSIDPKLPVVAITFDDGPTDYTNEVLQILKENDAVATFFVLGNKVEMYQNVIRDLVKNGSEIGNHTYNHKWLSRLSEGEIRFQIEKTQEKIKNITGIAPKFLRPTYGEVNQKIRRNTDLNIALWTVDPKDWKQKSPQKIASSILDIVEDEDIILLHDNHKRSVSALKILLPELKKQGYQFVTLSELTEVKRIREGKFFP